MTNNFRKQYFLLKCLLYVKYKYIRQLFSNFSLFKHHQPKFKENQNQDKIRICRIFCWFCRITNFQNQSRISKVMKNISVTQGSAQADPWGLSILIPGCLLGFWLVMMWKKANYIFYFFSPPLLSHLQITISKKIVKMLA